MEITSSKDKPFDDPGNFFSRNIVDN
jgi:hypothetical protein